MLLVACGRLTMQLGSAFECVRIGLPGFALHMLCMLIDAIGLGGIRRSQSDCFAVDGERFDGRFLGVVQLFFSVVNETIGFVDVGLERHKRLLKLVIAVGQRVFLSCFTKMTLYGNIVIYTIQNKNVICKT